MSTVERKIGLESSSRETELKAYTFKPLDLCEKALKLLGLSDSQIHELGVTIDIIGDLVFDAYFQKLYE